MTKPPKINQKEWENLNLLMESYREEIQRGYGRKFGLKGEDDDRSNLQISLAQKISKISIPLAKRYSIGLLKNYVTLQKQNSTNVRLSLRGIRNLTEEDLTQDGLMGLIYSLRKYKNQGNMGGFFRNNLSTRMLEEARKYLGIAIIPQNILGSAKKYVVTIPTNEEGIKGLEKNILSNYKRKKRDLPKREVAAIIYSSIKGEYIPTNYGKDLDWVLQHRATGRGTLRKVGESEMPGAELEREQRETSIREAIKTLRPREQKVIALRFGLNGKKESTLEEIGLKMKLTRERVRQIEAKTLRKLRKPENSRKLKDLL